jgi:2-phosphosulfolactate phosphatase
MAHDLQAALLDCVSGRELVARGFPQDVRIAAECDVSTTTPVLSDGAFTPTPA